MEKRKSPPRQPQPQSKALPALKQCAQGSLLASHALGLLQFPLPHRAPAPDSKCPLCPVCVHLSVPVKGMSEKRVEKGGKCLPQHPPSSTSRVMQPQGWQEEAPSEHLRMRDGQRDWLLAQPRGNGLKLHLTSQVTTKSIKVGSGHQFALARI